MSEYVKYGDVIVEINKTAGGYAFKCPLKGCSREVDVQGDIAHCKNRVHQHLHLEHKLETQKIADWPPTVRPKQFEQPEEEQSDK